MTPRLLNEPATTCTVNGQPVHFVQLNIDVEQIPVTSDIATEPDLGWTHVDAAGHFHAFTHDAELPTLRATRRLEPCPGGCDDPDCPGITVTTYGCVACAAPVAPGRRSLAGQHRTIPGRTTWSVEVETDRPLGYDLVSVVIDTAAGAGRIAHRMFGIATPLPPSVHGSSDGARFTTHLTGATPLGKRAR